eukprot:NODE_660_length_1448_cov_941.250893_g498_i0.p1 GENE.NODE_660_length_1448_cov_941.250893_g498_i0~~NODE_660_length_1448_cov_941.250893_g498_i0.p1  ORF type:complete len:408 (-),score=91.37 NODE_660_length_1448_cov_941.250893_g498_i0:152-1375(-)
MIAFCALFLCVIMAAGQQEEGIVINMFNGGPMMGQGSGECPKCECPQAGGENREEVKWAFLDRKDAPLNARAHGPGSNAVPPMGTTPGVPNAEQIGSDGRLFAIFDGVYNSLVLFTNTDKTEAILIDAPTGNFETKDANGAVVGCSLVDAIKAVGGTNLLVKTLILSHAHTDHIGCTRFVQEAWPEIKITASAATSKFLLSRPNAADRPVIDNPIADDGSTHDVTLGDKTVQVKHSAYVNHMSGNLFIILPDYKTIHAVDLVYPGWAPFKGIALSNDPVGALSAHEEILSIMADNQWTISAGHVTRLGNKLDVQESMAYYADIVDSTWKGLTAGFGTHMAEISQRSGVFDPNDPNYGNWWFLYGAAMEVAEDICFEHLLSKWKGVIAAVDTFGKSHCSTMVDKIRIE